MMQQRTCVFHLISVALLSAFWCGKQEKGEQILLPFLPISPFFLLVRGEKYVKRLSCQDLHGSGAA
jgi:hypothetical protein